MKPSIFNFIWPAEQRDKVIVFNSRTTALIELDKDCAEVLNKPCFDFEELSFGNRLLVEGMKEGGFVVDDEIDELKVVKFTYNRRKYAPGGMSLTITPTLLCNFACTYCFQQPGEGEDRPNCTHTVMSKPVQQELFNFVSRAVKNLKSLQVTWYGGEPLLAREVIFDLSEKFIRLAAENNITYLAYMVTNGYLADENRTIQELKESRISVIQVTLDGPPEVHNRRRMLKAGRGPTFERILNNIRLFIGHGLAVHLRINVDRLNMENVEELLDILESENLKDIQKIYLGQVHADTAGCKSVESFCTTTEEFTHFNCAFHNTLARRGFMSGKTPHYPRFGTNCTANRLNAFVIDPDGDLYKCWHEAGNKPFSIGNIAGLDKPRDRKQRMREIRWLTWEPFEYAGCLSCKLVPVCMGGCGYRAMYVNDNKPDCMEWKYGLEEYIKLCCRLKEVDE